MQMPGIAGVPGLAFRHPVGEADTDALLAVHAARLHRDCLDPLSLEGELPHRSDLAAMLARFVERSQLDRALVAEVSGCVVGYTRLTSWREAGGMAVLLVLGWVRPEWRGLGIGTTMLRWGEGRARELAASDHPGESFEFAGNASCTEHDAAALLRNEGYAVVFNVLEMEWEPRSLILPPLPTGLELRPALTEHCAQLSRSVYDAYNQEYPDRRFMEVADYDGYAADLAGP